MISWKADTKLLNLSKKVHEKRPVNSTELMILLLKSRMFTIEFGSPFYQTAERIDALTSRRRMVLLYISNGYLVGAFRSDAS